MSQSGAFAHPKVTAIRVLEYQCADAGLRIHHEPFRQLDSNFFRLQQLPNSGLSFQVRARRITEAVALPPTPGRKPLSHPQFRRVGEPPILPDSPVQPLRTSFRRLNRQRLQPMRLEVIPRVLGSLGPLPDSL